MTSSTPIGSDLKFAPRDRNWLFAFAHQPVQRTPRSARYLQQISKAGGGLTLDTVIHDDQPELRRYTLGRGGAALIGRSAFLFRTPGTKQYQNGALLEKIIASLRAFQRRQNRLGDFDWGDAWSAHLPHHEHAWRTEPLLWARVWLDEYLSASDQRWIDNMLARAGRRQLQFAKRSPNDVLQYCNRGAVWLTMVQLLGLYFDDRKYLGAVQPHADRIIRNVINPAGEVMENYMHYHGGGPDNGYSYTTWVYAMMFRMLHGSTEWDDRLQQGLRWITHYGTRRGHAIVSGASVRKAGLTHCREDLLPGYEFFADEEPWFDTLADRTINRGHTHGSGHTVQPCLWALLWHRPRPGTPRAPKWYTDYEGHFEHQPSQYSIITHRYQTGVTYRGLFPLKGIQTFAYGSEEPIVKHTEQQVSTTRVGRLDTAGTNVEGGLHGWEVFRRDAGPGDGYQPQSPATIITTRRGKVWECYVFTPVSAIHLVGSAADNASFITRWVLCTSAASEATLNRRERCVTFAGRKGRLCYLAQRAKIDQTRNSPVLEVHAPRGPIVCGLGGPDLQLEKLDRRGERLYFRDASGRYELSFAKMFDEQGQLDRVEQWYRLVRK